MYLCMISDHIIFSYEGNLNVLHIQVEKKNNNSQDTHKYLLPINLFFFNIKKRIESKNQQNKPSNNTEN